MSAAARPRHLGMAAALLALVAGCGSTDTATVTPIVVPDTSLTQLLLSTNDIQATMQSAPFKSQPVQTVMDDNRHLLKNVDCLGVWNSAESAVYGDEGVTGGWRSVRKQAFRVPGVQPWRSSVTQAVASFDTVVDARRFLADAGDRWSRCTEHTVNITINDQHLPHWRSGELRQGDGLLAMPIARSDDVEQSSCEHVLSQVSNVIIEVQTCAPGNAAAATGSDLAAHIAHNIPTAA